jgi:hypothetical protein
LKNKNYFLITFWKSKTNKNQQEYFFFKKGIQALLFPLLNNNKLIGVTKKEKK